MFIRSEKFFSFASYWLAYCLAEGASPTANGAGGGGGVATLITSLAHPPPRQQYGCNFTKESLVIPSLSSFWKDNARYWKKRKELRLCTVQRCQVVRSCLLHILSVSTLSFAEGKIEYPTKPFLKPFLLQVTCLLTALQRAQAQPLTEPKAEEALQRWSRAQPAQTPGSNTVVIFTKESSPNFLLLLKRHENQCWERCRFTRFSPETGKGTKISAERDAKSHVSPRKLEKFRLDRYRAVDHYSESKPEPLTAVWLSTIAAHNPIKVFWTTCRAVDWWTAIGYHIFSLRNHH